MPRSLSSLLWLALGAFAIGTEGFMIAGLLDGNHSRKSCLSPAGTSELKDDQRFCFPDSPTLARETR